MAIWDSNLKIDLCTTLIKVKVKVLDTYNQFAKQFDLDMSEPSGACVVFFGEREGGGGICTDTRKVIDLNLKILTSEWD